MYQFSDENPSCEVISRVLYDTVAEICGTTPVKVRVWESLDQYAEFSRDAGPDG